jgi:anch_rpt_ABC: anchored repeat-type ABC transporter, ATP-binding subunit
MLVHIENLVKRYGDLLALDHLSLDIEEGEIFGLLGPNGSGKTTAINCLLALLKYDKGTITIFGKDMKPDSYDIKQDIGVVMQNVAVFEQMSVYENIDYFCGLYIRDKQKRRELVEEAIGGRVRFGGIFAEEKSYLFDKKCWYFARIFSCIARGSCARVGKV